MSDIQNEKNSIDYFKYYMITKTAQLKYSQTEKGKQKNKEASQRYYAKKRLDKEYMQIQCDKKKEVYHRKKESLINLNFPDII